MFNILKVLSRLTKHLVTPLTVVFLQVLDWLIDTALLQWKELCH